MSVRRFFCRDSFAAGTWEDAATVLPCPVYPEPRLPPAPRLLAGRSPTEGHAAIRDASDACSAAINLD
ncbi:hypothetical protein E2C01_085254 [Portunus trituberculatus]|uniref:Uncharacterized protein n=1 Tax=Portunus trituberculatus TaxID=210409 RepID=A0A5B7JBF5_PORTR|nr:hypothetical protein [Portunus trituberculatus]